MRLIHGYHILEENIAGIITSLGLGGSLIGLINLFAGGTSSCFYLGSVLVFLGS